MHTVKSGIKGHAWLLGGIVALVALVAALPMFGSTSHATSGIDLNHTAATTEFLIPAGPLTSTAGAIPASGSLPALLSLNDDVTTLLPASGDLLVEGKTELISFEQGGGTPCGATAATEVCVTARAKVGTEKTHAASDVQLTLATQLTTALTATRVRCELGATFQASAIVPFGITCGATEGVFPKTGAVSITHADTTTSNVGGQTGELFQYDNNGGCGGTFDLCITARGQQANNEVYQHLAHGYNEPCTPNNGTTCDGTLPGTVSGDSYVNLIFDIDVKSNAGLFPSAPIVIYDVDGGNVAQNEEVFNYNNAAVKISTPTATELQITSRGGSTATFQYTTVAAHPIGSIVAPAHAQLVCRNGNTQVDTDLATSGIQEPAGQKAGTSVAAWPVCYTRTQPDGPPKDTSIKKLDVPLIGSTLVVLNAVGSPFLSTGGFSGLLGSVPHVDDNGTSDGTLILSSPCVIDFTPGTNLKTDVTLDTSDNDHTTPDTGTIKVVLDTIHDTTPANGDECDDPAGTGPITSTTYIYPGDGDTSDDDTDGDGCTDERELHPTQTTGGLRDPWNPHDFADLNGDLRVDVPNDIIGLIFAFGTAPGSPVDRGQTYGPFAWNKAGPDGNVDVPNDILGGIFQFQHDCRPSVPLEP